MAKRKKKLPPAQPVESQAAETVTVAWMLAVTVALLCELAWVAARWGFRFAPDAVNLGVLADLLFFSALVVGVVSLALLPVVLKSRRVVPPTAVTILALVAGSVPLLIMIFRAIF